MFEDDEDDYSEGYEEKYNDLIDRLADIFYDLEEPKARGAEAFNKLHEIFKDHLDKRFTR